MVQFIDLFNKLGYHLAQQQVGTNESQQRINVFI